MCGRVVVGILALAVLATPAIAITGTVVDERARPLQGARVCYLAGGAEALCTETNADGFFELPRSSIDRIRIRAEGYQILRLAAVDHDEPIALKRASSVLIRLRDATTGEPLDSGSVTLMFADGHKLGPAPVNRNGVRFRRQPPGRVIVRIDAAGYLTPAPRRATLVAGEETELVVELEPADTNRSND